MNLATLAAAMIRVFEGVKLTAYQDTGGVWTIGFGHTGSVDGVPIAAGMTITMEKAEDLLAIDAAPLFKQVAGLPVIEAACYVSFGYNCGAGALARVLSGQSNLTDFIRDRKKNVLPGLVSRRGLEAALISASRSMVS